MSNDDFQRWAFSLKILPTSYFECSGCGALFWFRTEDPSAAELAEMHLQLLKYIHRQIYFSSFCWYFAHNLLKTFQEYSGYRIRFEAWLVVGYLAEHDVHGDGEHTLDNTLTKAFFTNHSSWCQSSVRFFILLFHYVRRASSDGVMNIDRHC